MIDLQSCSIAPFLTDQRPPAPGDDGPGAIGVTDRFSRHAAGGRAALV